MTSGSGRGGSIEHACRQVTLACALALTFAAAGRAQSLPGPAFSVLHPFSGGADGGNPYAGLTRDAAGNLYGVTGGLYDGSPNLGTVFRIDASGVETILHRFTGTPDGANPYGGVILDSQGNLYGTTRYGGASGWGTVFKLDVSGTEAVLHSFTGGVDGANPTSALLLDSAGNLYGTTTGWGWAEPLSSGTVFKLDPAGSLTVLHNFGGGADGDYPQGWLVRDQTGNLYGTTYYGGSSAGQAGHGVVYRLGPTGEEAVLHTFTGGDGAAPLGGLIADAEGNLYGTTALGGEQGHGTIFRWGADSGLTVLYAFSGGLDGDYPARALAMDSTGNLYGTTGYGGAAGRGTVFALDKNARLSVLYSFGGGLDGSIPYSDLVLDAAGDLYGTTIFGGDADAGVVFRLANVGSAAPRADAGTSQSVEEGVPVTLDGTASSGQELSFAWEQIAGPPVALSSERAPTPSFVSPWLEGGVGGSQTLTFKLTVSTPRGSSSATVDVTVKNVDHRPEAVAGPSQAVNEGSRVYLDGTQSYDPDGDPITCSWEQTSGEPVTLEGSDRCTATFEAPLLPGGFGASETLAFRLTVGDTQLIAQGTTSVTVEQLNHSPVAVAGLDLTINESTAAALNGSDSSDPDGDSLTYSWSQASGPHVTLSDPAGPRPSFAAPEVGPGGVTLVFELVVSDAGGLSSAPARVSVTVADVNDSPLCALGRAEPALLWPPNHKMVPVRIVGVTDPQNEAVTITTTGVTQDEPVEGAGDGDTSPDASRLDGTVLIRAERAGSANGRVYRVQFVADDGRGGTCQGAVSVGVPHDAHGTPIDDGQRYDSMQP